MSRKSTIPVNLKVRPSFKQRLDIASDVLDIPYSQLMRDATDEKINELAKSNDKLRTALQAHGVEPVLS